jgi:preprotein translocase subunit YajC
MKDIWVMLIKFAHAAEDAVTDLAPDLAASIPSTGDAMMANMALVLVFVFMFYLLLFRPQQKRFKEHANMLGGLQKGAKVVTQGGLIGKIDKITEQDEVVLDLGNDQKVTVIRSAISSVYEVKPGNDNAAKSKTKDAAKPAKAKPAAAKKAKASSKK